MTQYELQAIQSLLVIHHSTFTVTSINVATTLTIPCNSLEEFVSLSIQNFLYFSDFRARCIAPLC